MEKEKDKLKDKIWIWGGPTPLWGGSMEKDCLLKGANYFEAENVIYMHGKSNHETLDIFKPCKKVLCQLTSINRNDGDQLEDDVTHAENLSWLSLDYENIKGGMIDDLSTYLEGFSPEKLRDVYKALKMHNSKLRLYAVCYTFHLDKNYEKYLPHIDVINLWVWRKNELETIDSDLDKCLKVFPGKPIILGIFMHDYGQTDAAMPLDLLEYNFHKAEQYLAEGKIEGIVILGDREIKKHPDQAEWIKNHLKALF